jgi:hypothetical protein
MDTNTFSHADLIQKTIEVWQPYFTTPLEASDAEEITARWAGFMNIVGQSLDSR